MYRISYQASGFGSILVARNTVTAILEAPYCQNIDDTHPMRVGRCEVNATKKVDICTESWTCVKEMMDERKEGLIRIA